jgi:hypothetical protein
MQQPLLHLSRVLGLLPFLCVPLLRGESLSFTTGLDGFSGSIEHAADQGRSAPGAVRMRAELAGVPEGQQAWIDASRGLEESRELQAVRFWVKSREATGLTVRIVDATGQTHQVRPKFPADGQWQAVEITDFENGPGHEHWGGADDKVVQWPAQSLTFILEKPELAAGGGNGAVLIDDLELAWSEQRVPGRFQLRQARLGNVFTQGETPRILVETQGDTVAWQARDYWGAPAGTGRVKVAEGVAEIRPEVGLGYYDVQLQALQQEQTLASGRTTLAVIPPADLAKMPDSPFGVATHFAQGWDVDFMQLLAKAGIGIIRDELYWKEVETQRGVYSFAGRYDTYMAEARRLGIRPLIAMTFANPLHDQGLTPHTPAGRQAYADYGAAILRHYGTQVRWLEIWNEYNGTWCEGPAREDRPRYYTEMLKTAYTTLKAERPDVRVLGGASVLIPLPYFQGLFQAGALDYMDGVVIHPYRGLPEGVETEIQDLKKLMAQQGKSVPVWVTETGSFEKGEAGRVVVARYLAAMYTLLLTETQAPICWYLARDYADFFSMGLLRDIHAAEGRYAPAPSYVSYANFIHQMYGARFEARETAPAGERTRLYLFRGADGQPLRVCWSTVPAHLIFQAKSPVTVTDLMGGTQTLHPVDGRVYLTLDDNPVYLRGEAVIQSGPGAFRVDPAPVIAAGAPRAEIPFHWANQGKGAEQEVTLELGEERADLRVAAGQRGTATLAVAGADTTRPAACSWTYRLTVDGRLAGRGVLQGNVVDTLGVVNQPLLTRADELVFLLGNSSPIQELTLEKLRWKLGGQSGELLLDSRRLPPRGQTALRLPVPPQTPFAELPLKLEVLPAGRAPHRWTGAVSYNPVAPAGQAPAERPITLVAPGENQVARAGWAADERGLYLSLQGEGDDIVLGLAPPAPEPGQRVGWYELALQEGNLVYRLAEDAGKVGRPVPQAQVEATFLDGGRHYRFSIPWAALPGLRPADGLIRLALAVGPSAAWGQGILQGKNPAAYRLCTLPGFQAADYAVPPAKAAPEPGKTVLIANSIEDYTANEQGQNGWSYGYFNGTGQGQGDQLPPTGPYTDDDFQPMTPKVTVWGYEWEGPHGYLKLDRRGGHPSAHEERPIWAVRRWTSPFTGRARVNVTLQRTESQGDGTQALLLLDGVVLQRVTLSQPGAAPFSQTVTLRQGSRLDLALTPGPRADTAADASELYLTVEARE